ncbi:ribbon-helix-helix protein, CopG family [Cetobacterium sp.]|uniref:ribbon-helix-helix protein, CopG family n=1 Tax=Cetobacterium sp. TaxID=2071632 RepID=UPI003F2F0B1F
MEKKENSIFFKPIVTFRLSKQILEKLEALAKQEKKTRTEIIVQMINKGLGL